MMIRREQFKLELDSVDDATINILHHIVMALKQSVSISNHETSWLVNNPLKNSVIYLKKGVCHTPLQQGNFSL